MEKCLTCILCNGANQGLKPVVHILNKFRAGHKDGAILKKGGPSINRDVSRDQCVINVIMASQTAILYKRISKKSRARVFNTFRAAQKQARYQYSGEFTSVFQ